MNALQTSPEISCPTISPRGAVDKQPGALLLDVRTPDAPGANHRWLDFRRGRGARAGCEPALYHYSAAHRLRAPVRGPYRLLRTGDAAGENAVEPPGRLGFGRLLRDKELTEALATGPRNG